MCDIWDKFRTALCISGGERRTPLTLSPPDLATGVGDGEDLLSALPDDVLLRLPSTAAAARTSVLSSRWRRLWAAHPPALLFPLPAEPGRALPSPASAHAALARHAAPELHDLYVVANDADPVDAAAMLRLAAPRLTGMLIFHNVLPCPNRAERLYLHLGYLRLALPPSGVLTKLTVLHLGYVRFQGACDVGDALSTARFPSLRELWLFDAQGVSSLAICSESLVSVNLHNLEGLQQLTLESPGLREASVLNCFFIKQPVADISAPVLEKLWWADTYDPSTVQLGELAQLQELAAPFCLPVPGYGLPEYMFNWSTLMLLQRFQKIPVLCLLISQPNMINCQYLMEDIPLLPDIENLCLSLMIHGHAIGICVFYFLKISTSIRRLDLIYMKALRIERSRYDIPFVKRLLGWKSVLKTVNISFSPSATVDEELCKELNCLARPETCMKIYLYRNGVKVKYMPVG
ncbi:hypothetical protein BS78_02G063900 [Paspalum vaginatum]|nr:hypothetical protein BS78_02G063900 [Paspalum vaginatum]